MKTLVLAVFLASLSAPAPLSAQAPSARPRTKLFQAQDLGLLEAPDRQDWQKPEQIMDTLRIAEGSAVADLGAGSGWFTMQLAKRVGPNGLVFSEDIQQPMIEYIGERARRENLRWVKPILGTTTDPNLPAPVDAVLIVDTYREVEFPVTFLKNAAKYLKPQGLIGVVDFLPGGGGPGPAPEDRPDPKAVVEAAEAAGLQLVKREDIPPFMFLLVFRRATAGPVP